MWLYLSAILMDDICIVRVLTTNFLLVSSVKPCCADFWWLIVVWLYLKELSQRMTLIDEIELFFFSFLFYIIQCIFVNNSSWCSCVVYNAVLSLWFKYLTQQICRVGCWIFSSENITHHHSRWGWWKCIWFK